MQEILLVLLAVPADGTVPALFADNFLKPEVGNYFKSVITMQIYGGIGISKYFF